MAFFWLWRSIGRVPRLTKRARTMADFLDQVPDLAAPKPCPHRPQLLEAGRSLPFVASSFFPGPGNHQSVRCADLLTWFKHPPTWRESRWSVSYLSAGCSVRGGTGKFFVRNSSGAQGPGGEDAGPAPSDEDVRRYGPFRDELRVGRYKMGKALGSGSYGMVRAAYNVETGDLVAVKMITKRTEPLKVEHNKQQLRREVHAMTRVAHPNIVQLLEVMGTKEKIYLVMELLRGGDLDDNVKGRPENLSEAEARRYFQQILSAVNFCHQKGVYHRDLKPANVLLDADSNAKVADFGLGALADADNMTYFTANLLLKSMVGTPLYMAPEILDRALVPYEPGVEGYSGAKADIFSCGVILYFLLSRQIPFIWRDSMLDLQRHKKRAQYPPWPQEIGEEAQKLITSMLDPDPAKRISMESIFKDHWFKKDYNPPNFLVMKEVATGLQNIDKAFKVPVPLDRTKLKPASLNAFSLIAGAPSFNLGPMVTGTFTDWEERRYISKLPPLQTLERIAWAMVRYGYYVEGKGFKIRLDSAMGSHQGPLCIVAEAFQAGKDLVVVDVRKVVGDPQEFKFFFIRFTTVMEDVLELVECSPESAVKLVPYFEVPPHSSLN